MIEYNQFGELDEIIDAEYDFLDSEVATSESEYHEGIPIPSMLQSSLEHYAGQINQEIEGMSDDEIEEYMEIAWAPIITSLVSALAPVAINAVGGLVRKISSPRRTQRPTGSTARVAPRPAPRPNRTRSQPVPTATSPARTNQFLSTLRSLGGGAMQQLASLLQNPNVVNAISNVATTGINAAVARNNTANASPTTTDVVDAIHHLTSEIMQNTADTEIGIPEYMYSEDGELLGDPYSPSERAAVIVENLGQPSQFYENDNNTLNF